jgi:hypothetical protein
MQVRFEKAPDKVLPKCPFCESRLDEVWIKAKGRGIVEQERIVICPKGESFLGFGSMMRREHPTTMRRNALFWGQTLVGWLDLWLSRWCWVARADMVHHERRVERLMEEDVECLL